MKKLIGLLVAGLTISALMAGCSQPQEGDNAGTAPGAKTNTTPATPAPSSDTAGAPGAATGSTTPPATTGK